MAVLNKEQVMKQIRKIFAMSLEQLEQFSVKVSMSSADAKAKSFFYKAIDARKSQLAEIADAKAVNGDIEDMEFVGGKF